MKVRQIAFFLISVLLVVPFLFTSCGEKTPTTEVTTESTIEPATGPTAEPTTEPTTKSTTEPTATPTSEVTKTEYTPEEKAAISDIVTKAGKFVPISAEKDEIISSEAVEEGDYKTIYEQHELVENIESVTYLGQMDYAIWPGSLVKGDRAQDFIYKPISVERAPVTLSISLEGSQAAGEPMTRVVDTPKPATINQGISDLLKDTVTDDTNVPAKVEFKYKQVYNQSQVNPFVGVDVSYGADNLDTRFDWDSANKRNKIIASYKQIYYTIDIDIPESPADIFAPTAPITDIEAAIPAGSMPLYISSASYGMMTLVFIETDYSFEQMQWALDAAYSGTVGAEASANITDILESANIQTIVYGGSAAGLQKTETGCSGLMNVMNASRDFNASSPGVPLVYTLRNLADNTPALITLTSQYTSEATIRWAQRVRVTVDRFVCNLANEGDEGTLEMNIFYVRGTAYNRLNDSDPGSLIGTENQTVFAWTPRSPWRSDKGNILDANEYKPNTLDITFDIEYYNFKNARLHLEAYAREVNSSAPHDEATASWEITGDHFLDNEGKHTFTLSDNNEFSFIVHITIELLE